jgi:hypothetical protein
VSIRPCADVDLDAMVSVVNTAATARWAVAFYERHGFTLVTPAERDRLLRRYWRIPERQVETSVVMRLDR